MDRGYCSNDEFDACEAEDVCAPPEIRLPSPRSTGSNGDIKHVHSLASSSSPSPKRSRRSVQKRVVSIPISEIDGSRAKGGAGEGAPPSDSWTWRKYGQKPIKGSPFPRGYYRCSSSKGCPARKQVERSRLDPSMIVVTYAFDHNHPWPLPKNSHQQKTPAAAKPKEEQPPPLPVQQQTQANSSPPESTEREDKFSDLLGEEESSLLIHTDEFHWFSEVGSTSSDSLSAAAGADELLYSSIFFGGGSSNGGITGAQAPVTAGLPEERGETGGGAGVEDDPLFAGLGELPEYSVVFRRGLASATW